MRHPARGFPQELNQSRASSAHAAREIPENDFVDGTLSFQKLCANLRGIKMFLRIRAGLEAVILVV